MKRKACFVLGLASSFALLGMTASAAPVQSVTDIAGLNLGIMGGAAFPIIDSPAYFGTGFYADLTGDYRFPALKNMDLAFSVGYDYLPLSTGPLVHVVRGEAGLGYSLPLGSDLGLRVSGLAGYYNATLAKVDGYSGVSSTNSGGVSASGGLSLDFRGIPNLDLSLGGRYRGLIGLYNGIEANLTATLNLSKTFPPASKGSLVPRIIPLDLPGELNFGQLSMDNVFPVFFKYYNNHSMGKAVLTNSGKKPISDVSVTFNMKQYMDSPKVIAKVERMQPGQSVPVQVYALFTDRILGITEGTVVSADVQMTYTEDGRTVTANGSEAIRVLDRNAMSWFDDRIAAAYITAKDPAILGFAKNVLSATKESVRPGVNKNLQIALALHDALDLYGMTYVLGPQSPSAENRGVVDNLQFPRQTLDYKGGKCGDLTVLFSALLESVGIETAYITVPGHIFAAFDTGLSVEGMTKLYSRPDDFIVKADKVWIPVEITDRNGGFFTAWSTGAKEWRENIQSGTAVLYPVHDAWTVFEPVGLPGESAAVVPPSNAVIIANFTRELTKFIDRELSPQVAKLNADIQAGKNASKSLNSLGVLYAKYGLLDQAANAFNRILVKTDYLPALINMGNLSYLRKDLKGALKYFLKGNDIDPENALIVLNLARINLDNENFDTVKVLYAKLGQLNPGLAKQFAYLGTPENSGSRAADVSSQKETMVWSGE